MSRRVRSAVAALFALVLVVQAPVAYAARERDRAFEPSFTRRIIKVVKKVLKPLGVTICDDDEFMPTPPKP